MKKHVVDDSLIYEILSVVEEVPEGKAGDLRTNRPLNRKMSSGVFEL